MKDIDHNRLDLIESEEVYNYLVEEWEWAIYQIANFAIIANYFIKREQKLKKKIKKLKAKKPVILSRSIMKERIMNEP